MRALFIILIAFLFACKGEKEMIQITDTELKFVDSLPKARYYDGQQCKVKWYVYEDSFGDRYYRLSYAGPTFVIHHLSTTKQ